MARKNGVHYLRNNRFLITHYAGEKVFTTIQFADKIGS